MWLTPELLVGDEDCRQEGRFCRMVKSETLQAQLEAQYGRPGLTLKINKDASEGWEWSDPREVAMVQNIGAIHGCAPRAYDVIEVHDGYQAQVSDWVDAGHEPTLETIERLLWVIREYGLDTRKIIGLENHATKWDIIVSVNNWSEHAFLDWGGYYLRDPESYRAKIVDALKVHISTSHKGQPTETTYQSLSGLDISGDRDTEHRLEVMRWDDTGWGGLDVLDLGCNLGAFCFEAIARGARRVVGVDVPFIAEPMRHAANWLGHWNADFYGLSLPSQAAEIQRLSGLDSFDVVLALSVCNHIGGYAPWIAELVRPGGLLYLETHGDQEPSLYEDALRRDFETVEFLGYTTDVKRRGVFRCHKGDA